MTQGTLSKVTALRRKSISLLEIIWVYPAGPAGPAGVEGVSTNQNLQVLSGIFRVAAMKDARSGVGWPFTWVMKLVGATPYW